MHTHILHSEDGEEFVVNVNGDFSGDAWITGRTTRFSETHRDIDPRLNASTLKIPFEVLEELVGRKIQSDMEAWLENIDGRQFLQEVFKHRG